MTRAQREAFDAIVAATLAQPASTPALTGECQGVVWVDLYADKFGRHWETSKLAKDMPTGRYLYTAPSDGYEVADDGLVKRAMLLAHSLVSDSVAGHPARMLWMGRKFLMELAALSRKP